MSRCKLAAYTCVSVSLAIIATTLINVPWAQQQDASDDRRVRSRPAEESQIVLSLYYFNEDTLVSGYTSGFVRFWDGNGRFARRELRLNGSVHTIGPGISKETILVGSFDGDLIVLDRNGHEVRRCRLPHYLTGGVLNKDSLVGVAGASDDRIFVYSLDDCQQKSTFSGHEGGSRFVEVLDDAVVTGGYDGRLRTWVGNEGMTLTEFSTPVSAMAVSKEFNLIVAASVAGDLRCWRRSDLKPRFAEVLTDVDIACLAIQSEQVVFVGSRGLAGGLIRVNIRDKTTWRDPRVGQQIRSMAICPDNRRLAIGGDDGHVRVVDITNTPDN